MYSSNDSRSRALSAAGAIGVQGLLLLTLARGLGVSIVPEERRALRVHEFALDPPPPEIEPKRTSAPKPREEGAASPPNIVSRATEVAAPPPTLPIAVPMPAATAPAQGPDVSSGAAPIPGPGTGAGGQGEGTGSGEAGNGPGGGGGTVLRLLKGDLYDDDYPDWATVSGTVHFRLSVGTNGRVSECRVTRSSGDARLDALTCRLIVKRFRYAPSRDARGRPYVDTVIGEQTWLNEDRPEG